MSDPERSPRDDVSTPLPPSPGCRDTATPPSGIAWAHTLAAAVAATRCARWAYERFQQPQEYPEPIVGNLAWSAASKASDYAAPLALVAGFLVGVAFLSALAGRIRRTVGPAAAARVDALLLVACAPAGAWLAGLVATSSTSFLLFRLSTIGVALVAGIAALLSLRGERFWQRDVTQFSRVLGTALVLLPAVWLGTSAVGMALSRLRALRHGSPLSAATVDGATTIVLVVASVALVALVLLSRTASGLDRTIARSVLAVQLLFPGFFLVLVPRPWVVSGRAAMGYPVTAWTWLLVGVLAVAAFAELARAARRMGRAGRDDPFALFTVMSAVAALLAFKAVPIGLPTVSADDYHFGELLVPWWSFVHEHMLPFADYSPARGLVNYLPGAAASAFFDGTAASVYATWPLVYLPILLVAVPVLRWTMSLGWAVLALALALPANGFSEIDILVAAYVALVCRGVTAWRSPRWMAVWILGGTALVLFAPGQGGLAVLATMPLGAWMAARGLARERAALGRTLAAIAVVALAGGLLTPAGKMILGAVRYGAEQSSVNSVAHGIPWAASFGAGRVNPLLYEIVRASWLLVALWAGALLVSAARAARSGRPAPVLPYAISILLLATLFVFRAAGRIDPGPSRLGLASMWALALLLPLLLHGSTSPGRRGAAVLAWVSLAGLVLSTDYQSLTGLPHSAGLSTRFAVALDPVRGVPESLTNGGAGAPGGLAALGNALADPAHVARLTAARAVLDRVLEPGETYLDLSGRHAQYFYFGRRPPIETGSVYNLVAEAQQRRAVEALRRDPPPAVLLSADNLLYDGGPLGLRSHLLYRHVLTSPGYDVVVVGKQVWLLRGERVPRLSDGGPAIDHSAHAVDDATDSPLHDVLQAQELAAIPASWGGSAASLERGMRAVTALPPSTPESSVEALGGGRYRVVGPHPRARLDLSSATLAGADAGILSFDFRCERAGGPPPTIELRWSSASNPDLEQGRTWVRFEGREGRLMVPLDASPAWLLAREIRSLRLEVNDRTSCSTFQVSDVRLLQRHGVAPVPDRPPAS